MSRTNSMFYRRILKPIFFLFDPETIHNVMVSGGEFMGDHIWSRKMIDILYGYHGPEIKKVVDGITYKTPFLLAAGFDYNGRLTRILPSIALAGEEVGSVTARPCEGNPKPRLIRLPKSRSIVVNKGLKNAGVDAVIERLGAMTHTDDFVVGISIARTNDQGSADLDSGIKDYAYSFKRLNEAGIGHFYTLNISCPNSFTGETFATPASLEKLLSVIDGIPCDRPVYVKMPINLPWNEFDDLLKVCDHHRINGVVIGNLNKDYSYLSHKPEIPGKYIGGLSGHPTRGLSTELIGKTRHSYGRRFTIIGAGGVMSEAEAREKFQAGADLIQLMTGLIYEGPGVVKEMCRHIACIYSEES